MAGLEFTISVKLNKKVENAGREGGIDDSIQNAVGFCQY
jgi:hypothetical protein